jgi:hydrogenase maturation protease
VLVLGLGNELLGDDGFGPVLIREIERKYRESASEVECLDGGTQGLALLGRISRRKALIVLDALMTGQTPGTVSVFAGEDIFQKCSHRSTTAHEGNAGELLAAARLLQELPEQIFLVGMEPETVRTQLGLSKAVEAALPVALERACQLIESVRCELGLSGDAQAPCGDSRPGWPAERSSAACKGYRIPRESFAPASTK